MKRSLAVFLAAAAGCLFLPIPGESGDRSLPDLAAVIPRQTREFAAQGPDEAYDRKSIFDYIDGAGEIYLAYNMRGCLSRRYAAAGEPAIVLDLFDMGSSADAFGVFTHDRDGEPADIGEDGLRGDGWVRFWKGRFFASIYAERETAAVREAASRLARAVEAGIGEKGERPRILERLPGEGLQTRSIRYLHDHVLLDTHARVFEENTLGLGPDTDVLLASYLRDGGRARLLLVFYPDAARAAAARGRYLSLRPPGAAGRETVVMASGKWTAVAQEGRLLAVVLGAENRSLAEALLREAGVLP